MSESLTDYAIPWLPEGRTLVLPGRGEMFYRLHRHPDRNAPVALLLHGWTATGDLQFFTAFEELARHCSFLVVDHRGHGRGLRPLAPFALEDVADDAAAIVEALGVGPVIVVGYSMGGPLGMLLAYRHPQLVRGIVVQATALEWCATRFERVRWRTVHLIGPLLRSFAYRRWLRDGLRRLLGVDSSLQPYVPWITGELRRNDASSIVQAGQALSCYDARPWAAQLGKPAGALITTNDHLVKPRKQRALADALGAVVREVDGDHVCMWKRPDEFAAATVELIEKVAAEAATLA